MKKKVFFLFLFLLLPIRGHAASDAEYNRNQRAYDSMNLFLAYNSGYTGAGVTVAIIDDGVLMSHQELAGQFSPLQNVGRYNDSEADGEFGTMAASIIAGKKDRNGMHGIAYDAKLLSFAIETTNSSCVNCYTFNDVLNFLADTKFDSVKIITDSILKNESEILPNSTIVSSSPYYSAAKALTAKDKLLILPGGASMQLSPTSWAGLPYFSSETKYNVINTIAYDPNYSSSSPHFLSNTTNLAKYAQKWSLTAPVGFYTAVNTGTEEYGTYFSESFAASATASAAAIVSSVFPYMGGKQIADVLLSTTNSNFAGFSNYIVRNNGNGKVQFLFFGNSDGYGQEWNEDDKTAIVESELGSGKSCSTEGVDCQDMAYADAFGQGVLNVGQAVKGPGAFDIGRLKSSDYWDSQYWYTVDTKGYDSIWSNDIKQVQADSSGQEKVGVLKKGAGTLTLSGTNTFNGKSRIEAGALNLAGQLSGSVDVAGGSFSIQTGAVLNGDLKVFSSGTAYLKGGSLVSYLENSGTVYAYKGNVTGMVTNNGVFYISGTEENGVIFNGDFNTTGSMRNKKTLELREGGVFRGTINNEGVFNVTGNGTVAGSIRNSSVGRVIVNQGAILTETTGNFDNMGYLGGSGTINGTVNNNEIGTVETSLTLSSLDSSGKIALVLNGSTVQPMQVDTLNITGGEFVLSGLSKEYEDGKTYTAINFNTLNGFQNFSPASPLTGYINAKAIQRANSIEVKIEYQDLASVSNSPNLSASERKTAQIVDKMFKNGDIKGLNNLYLFNQGTLKKELGNLNNQTKPVQFSSLPLSDKLTRGIRTHIFERQNLKDPARYEGKKQYYSPSSRSNPPRGDVYRNYRPDNAPQQNIYRYKTPPVNDVYRQYRPGANGSQQNYRYYTPKKNDVYKAFRPNGRSGGQAYRTQKQVWGQMLYHRGTIDGTDNAADTDVSGMGMMFGWDFIYSKDFLWGLTAGYAQSSLDLDNASTDMTDWRFGAYFSRQTDFLSVDGVLMFGIQNYDKKRTMILPMESLTSTASYGGKSIEAALNVGYDIQQVPMQAGDWSFRPYVGLSVVRMSQDAYKEKGNSALNLSVAAVNDTSVTLSPGLIAGFIPGEMSILLFQPEYVFFDFRYDQAMSGGTSKTKAYFSMDTLQETFDSPASKEKSALSVGIGINGRLSEATRLNLLLNKRKGENSDINSISVSVIHSF